jgi:predicted RNase H-like nuclease (RuvC/YqgF family)
MSRNSIQILVDIINESRKDKNSTLNETSLASSPKQGIEKLKEKLAGTEKLIARYKELIEKYEDMVGELRTKDDLSRKEEDQLEKYDEAIEKYEDLLYDAEESKKAILEKLKQTTGGKKVAAKSEGGASKGEKSSSIQGVPPGAKVVFGKVVKDGKQIGSVKDGKFSKS